MSEFLKNKKIIILFVFVVIVCVLFVPFIKIPQDNVFTCTSDEKSDLTLIYKGKQFLFSNWYEFDKDEQINLDPNQYSYDFIPQKFKRIFSKNKVSVFNYFAAPKYYSASDSFVLVHYPGVGIIPLAENFIYTNEDYMFPDFEAYNISKIDIVRFEEFFNSNWDLESHKSDFLKYVYDKEAQRDVLFTITNKTEIYEFVKGINDHGTVEDFYKKIVQEEGLEDEIYFRIIFQNTETPFYLSIYSQETIDKVFS